MTTSDWNQDPELGAGFVSKTLFFGDDYDGPVTATLVRNQPCVEKRKPAVLYIHGYIDYFFQKHVAHRFNAEKHNFYGLDLRKYGRSLMAHQRPNICLTFEEYFPEITESLKIIAKEGHTSVVLMAHSTGALPGTLYAKEGSERNLIARIIFNSPFLKIPNAGAGLLASCGERFPYRETDNRINKWYVRSLHKSDKGEWDFNLTFKPFEGFRAYWGWVRAVYLLQQRIQEGGLRLEQPVLVLHSDKSLTDKEWSERLHRADLVLKVKDIKERGPLLGPPGRVVVREIRDGKHDLTLSLKEPREECLDAMVQWAGAATER
jgi:alpha-beta hydrolase superfamily lysophospholipase